MSRSAAGRIASMLFGLILRFTAALCTLTVAVYFLSDARFLPSPNIPNAAVIAVLGTPGLLLLISLRLLF